MDKIYDMAIVGGGINGAGIARDAAGRGLSVFLCERGDLAQGTSSASTKLIHGGLRYLEFYEFRLVSEALREREVLLQAAPHIIWPLSFVMPHNAGLRPAWLIRLGLFLYDHLGGRKILPSSYSVDLNVSRFGKPLKKFLRKAFVYSDCWVEDSRLVVLTAMDAAQHGATIRSYTSFVGATEEEGYWLLTVQPQQGEPYHIKAKTIVNAAGPGLDKVAKLIGSESGHVDTLRLVKGSHIVVPKLYEGEHAYILQNDDRRMIFVIPFEQDYSLIGTTDRHVDQQEQNPKISDDEIEYLLKAVNIYFNNPVTRNEIVYTYSGIRPLFDDGAENDSRVTRDYHLALSETAPYKPNVLNVYGGKITTFRRLAEEAVNRIVAARHEKREPWTALSKLPGGNIHHSDMRGFIKRAQIRHTHIPRELLERLAYTYGTKMHKIIGDCKDITEMGENFGGVDFGALTGREVDYLLEYEWAHTTEDILFRRTRLGMIKNLIDREALEAYIARKLGKS
jgi:glycerol-3-phosphate dehydrogenase